MKKFIALILSLVLMLSASGSVLAQENTNTNPLTSLMKDLEIMSGDENGNFNLSDLVTRAEFAKMAVLASEVRNSVAKVAYTSPFHDVPFTYWGASYIRAAVNNGYIKGYPDSTFRPENNVTLEEGVTIVLKLLGYGDDYFDLSWPDGQMNAASRLELLDGVNASLGQTITRGDVVQLLYNALTTNVNNKNQTLLSSFGYSYSDDVILVATSNEDSTISANKIVTSNGTYKISSSFNKSLCGYKGELILNNSGTAVSFLPSNVRGGVYTLSTVLNDDILVYSGNSTTSLNVGQNTTVYYKTEKTNLSGAKAKASVGDSVSVYENVFGDTEYILIGSQAMTGPITVLSSLETYGINDQTVIYKNGKSVTRSDIYTKDILYYSKAMNVAWVYSNKVTGVFESASPNQDTIESVVISGKSYNLESSLSYEKFVTGGKFALGDTVTIYLGRTGAIADAYHADEQDSLVGYLTKTGTKQYENTNGSYSSYYATVAFADGNTVEYKTEKNYENYVCSLVNVSFNEDGAKINKISTSNNTYSGKFDAYLNTFGNLKLADDVKIMDIANLEVSKSPSYTTVYKQRLDGVTLTSKQVLYFDKNKNGEITSLYLNNATGDCYTFGIVTDINRGSYSFNFSGTTASAGGNTSYSVSKGNAVKALVAGGSVSSVQRLSEVPENFKSASDTTLTFGNTSYKVYDKIAVYERVEVGQWQNITYADFLSGPTPKSVQGYFDKTEANGGRVRVLVITR